MTIIITEHQKEYLLVAISNAHPVSGTAGLFKVLLWTHPELFSMISVDCAMLSIQIASAILPFWEDRHHGEHNSRLILYFSKTFTTGKGFGNGLSESMTDFVEYTQRLPIDSDDKFAAWAILSAGSAAQMAQTHISVFHNLAQTLSAAWIFTDKDIKAAILDEASITLQARVIHAWLCDKIKFYIHQNDVNQNDIPFHDVPVQLIKQRVAAMEGA